jgi:hypothetical protein
LTTKWQSSPPSPKMCSSTRDRRAGGPPAPRPLTPPPAPVSVSAIRTTTPQTAHAVAAQMPLPTNVHLCHPAAHRKNQFSDSSFQKWMIFNWIEQIDESPVPSAGRCPYRLYQTKNATTQF